MSELLYHETPLSAAERAERWNHETRIKITHRAARHTIEREWVRSSNADSAPMGYAEKRGASWDETESLDLNVRGKLDVLALVKVITDEIERQQTAGEEGGR